MYRIELAQGEEAAFRSIEELATGIKSGVITNKCRIYHAASDKWLPIEFHPHYKKALALISQGEAEEGRETAVVMKLEYAPPKKTREIEFIDLGPDAAFKPPAPRPEPLPRSAPVATPAAAPTPKPAPTPAPPPPVAVIAEAPPAAAGRGAARRRRHAGAERSFSFKPRRPFVIALMGMVLVLVTHVTLPAELPTVTLPAVDLKAPLRLASSGASAVAAVIDSVRPGIGSTTPATLTPAPVHLPNPEPPRFGGTSVRTAEPAPIPAAVDTVATPAAPVLAPDPGDLALAVSHPVSPTGTLADRYAAAYDELRGELDLGLRNAGFTSIFDPSRLEPQRIAATRIAVVTAANHLKVYQRRAADVELAYRDSAVALTDDEARAWEQRSPSAEAAGTTRLTAGLLQAIDTVYGLLSAQKDRYVISGGGISFTNTEAAAKYGLLRRQVLRQLDTIERSPAASSTSMQRVLQAIGGVRLPEER